MKINLESLFVIIATVLFLIVSGLSRRRKKKPVMKSNLNNQPSEPGFNSKDLLSDAVTMINDPFTKLEKIFSTTEEIESQEGESLETTRGMDQVFAEIQTGKKVVLDEVPAEKEAKSLEVVIDEVSEYLKQKEIEKSTVRIEKKFDDFDLTMQEKPADKIMDQKKKPKIPLFENIDEVKKALIYSEILKRKEF